MNLCLFSVCAFLPPFFHSVHHGCDKINRAKVTEIARSSIPIVTHMSLVMQLQLIVEGQQKPYYSQDAKIRNLKDMASTLAFCQENHIELVRSSSLSLPQLMRITRLRKGCMPRRRKHSRKLRKSFCTQNSVTLTRRYISSL